MRRNESEGKGKGKGRERNGRENEKGKENIIMAYDARGERWQE